MNAREAIEVAKGHFVEIFADEGITEVGLEEVEFERDDSVWSITIGFRRAWQHLAKPGAFSVSPPVRTYKIVKIRDSDGTLVTIRHREVPAALMKPLPVPEADPTPAPAVSGAEELVVDPDDGDDNRVSVRYLTANYGSDMPVETLVRRLEREEIFLPEFRRRLGWSQGQASRFVESLILGLPAPGIFLFREPDTRKLLVVDGRQRLLTLSSFYGGRVGEREFRLTQVGEDFEGKTYRDLSEEDRRALDDTIVHATIVHQDEPAGDRSSVYSVFERLSAGGGVLQPQEIRSCVYRGPFLALLEDLAQAPDWRRLYGPASSHKKDEEIILRFLALHNALDDYASPLKGFLNGFVQRHRSWTADAGPPFPKQFHAAVTLVAERIGRRAFRPERALNASVADAVLCGVAHRFEIDRAPDDSRWAPAWEELLERLQSQALISGSTAQENRVRKRVTLAREVFAAV